MLWTTASRCDTTPTLVAHRFDRFRDGGDVAYAFRDDEDMFSFSPLIVGVLARLESRTVLGRELFVETCCSPGV
jgi:hypothetical protein